MKILGVTTRGGLSGTGNSQFFAALKPEHDVRSIRVELSGIDYLANQVRSFTFCPNPNDGFPASIFPYQKNLWSFTRRSKICESKLNNLTWKPDLILEIGSWLLPKGYPYACYIDMAGRMADKAWPTWSRYRSPAEKTCWLNLQGTLFSHAFKVFTMSEYTRKSIIQEFQLPPGRVTNVYAGPNLEKLPSLKKDVSGKLVLFVGYDFKRKGGVTLFNAFKEVKKKVKDAALFIVGTKPNISSPGVVVKGFVDKRELSLLYKKASIFVMPSIYEPFGFVFLEAMAYKTPCIGSDRNAIPEIIEDGRTGFIVTANDSSGLAEKMVYLLENEDLMEKMGEEGRRKIETTFNWNAVAQKMTQEFSS